MGFSRSVLSVLILSWPLLVVGQPDDSVRDGLSGSEFSRDSGFKDWKSKELKKFSIYKKTVTEEFKEFSDLYKQVSENYERRVSEIWANPEQSSKTRWINYGEGYRVKRVVDFEQEQVIWSTPEKLADSVNLSKDNARQMLKALMSMTRKDAFEQDEIAQETEEKSLSRFEHLETASLDDNSLLLPGFLFGQDDVSEARLNQAVEAMLAAGRNTTTSENGQPVRSWVFPLTSGARDKTVARPQQKSPPPDPLKNQPHAEMDAGPVLQTFIVSPENQNKLPPRARPFIAAINKEHRELELSPELLLAIIETESAFNPMAKSPIPAFGLMQIVPESAGQDATEKLFGKPRVLAPSYLYNADNNIRIGSAYLNILYYRYFKGIENPLSRLYCAIAAYNTGPGNVSAALTGAGMRLAPAISAANRMTPSQVYNHLLENLPYEETVHYLRKVTTRLDRYKEVLSEG